MPSSWIVKSKSNGGEKKKAQRLFGAVQITVDVAVYTHFEMGGENYDGYNE